MPWYIEGGGNYIINGQKVWGRNIVVPVDEVDAKIRARFNNLDAFATVYCYDDPDQNKANIYGPLYIDLDLKMKNSLDYKKVVRDLTHVVTTLNTFYMVPYELIQIFFSGNKGFHIIVPPEVFGIRPNQTLNDMYRAVAHDMKKLTMFKTVDTGIYDRVRLFRLPNSQNSATGLYKVPVTYEFARSCSYEDMIHYASIPKEDFEFPEPYLVREAARRLIEVTEKHKEQELARTGTLGVRKNGELPICIKNMLAMPAAQGTRNNTTVILASSLCQNGMDYGDAVQTLLDWNSTYNIPRLPDREVTRTVRSAYDEFSQGKAYGCRAIKELGQCVSGCPIATKVQERGNKNGVSVGNGQSKAKRPPRARYQ